MALPTKIIVPGDPQGLNRLNENFGYLDQTLDIALSETDAALLMADRLYPGVDLTVKHRAEINAAPHNGNPWAWVQARIRANNFNGIHVGDFIPFTVAGNTYRAEVAGINTYRGYGDVEVPNHIDFITRELWPDTVQWNRADFNNGLAAMPTPFLVSNVYAFLNGLQMDVPDAATANPTTFNVDYRTSGIYPQLPANLRNVIIQKRVLMPRRYTAGALLMHENFWDWRDSGFLWLPSEMEVYGTRIWGTTLEQNQGRATSGYQQYPIFAENMKRVKRIVATGARSTWWLSTPGGGFSTGVASTHGVGNAGISSTSSARYVPLCFRIA